MRSIAFSPTCLGALRFRDLAQSRLDQADVGHCCQHSWFEILPIKEMSTIDELMRSMTELYQSKGEGIVVKNPDSQCVVYFLLKT